MKIGVYIAVACGSLLLIAALIGWLYVQATRDR